MILAFFLAVLGLGVFLPIMTAPNPGPEGSCDMDDYEYDEHEAVGMERLQAYQ